MVYSSIRIMVTSSNLIWTIPLITRCTHTFYILVTSILLLAISHSNAIHMLRLPFTDNTAHWLGNVVRAHWRVLLLSIMSEVHLIHVIDSTLSHLIL